MYNLIKNIKIIHCKMVHVTANNLNPLLSKLSEYYIVGENSYNSPEEAKSDYMDVASFILQQDHYFIDSLKRRFLRLDRDDVIDLIRRIKQEELDKKLILAVKANNLLRTRYLLNIDNFTQKAYNEAATISAQNKNLEIFVIIPNVDIETYDIILLNAAENNDFEVVDAILSLSSELDFAYELDIFGAYESILCSNNYESLELLENFLIG